MQLMLQATIGDCLSFDPFAFEEDGLRPSEVSAGVRLARLSWCRAWLYCATKAATRRSRSPGRLIVLEQDAVLERLMPALDLALGPRVIRGAADVLYFLPGQPRREILCDV
jgi:hypothetical protein